MDPITIGLIASGLIEAFKFISQMIAISNNPASTPEQKAAALKAAQDTITACAALNAQWTALLPH